MLSDDEAVKQARKLRQQQEAERRQLDVVRRYWKGRQRFPAVIPDNAPRVVRTMARIARVNICPIIIDSLAQSTFVDGFRSKDDNNQDDVDAWKVWQANKLDARQTGIHRAAFAYGTAYAIVLPGEDADGKSMPVIRGVSPRMLTAMYGEDPDWPELALERRPRLLNGREQWRLYDGEAVYSFENATHAELQLVGIEEHTAGVTPVIRYLDEDDLDCEDEAQAEFNDRYWKPTPTRGQIAPIMTLQDQIDHTTFGLLVAQHFSAFRQRWVIGWLAAEEDKLKAGASQLWTFEDSSDGEGGVKVGEFGQTDLSGYIESREASLRHAATLSQTPVHELIGEMVNITAEALAAAEQGHERKVDERKTLIGESHEQTLRLAGKLGGFDVPEDAQVVWRDTSARTFAATVDGLGKLVTMLGVPPQMLWEQIPNVTQQDVARWKAASENGDAFKQLTELLNRQNQPPDEPPAPAPAA